MWLRRPHVPRHAVRLGGAPEHAIGRAGCRARRPISSPSCGVQRRLQAAASLKRSTQHPPCAGCSAIRPRPCCPHLASCCWSPWSNNNKPPGTWSPWPLTCMARGRALVPLLLLAALDVHAGHNGGPQTTTEGQHWPPAAAHLPLAPPPPALAARKAIQRSTNSSADGTAAAAARASKRQSLAWKHKRRPCAANDAKCVALRDHEVCCWVLVEEACLSNRRLSVGSSVGSRLQRRSCQSSHCVHVKITCSLDRG